MGVEEEKTVPNQGGRNKLTTHERRLKAWGVDGNQHKNTSNVVGVKSTKLSSLGSDHPLARVTALDKALVRKMMAIVANPPVSMKLWDGCEVTEPVKNPVARIQFQDRTALFKLLLDPELHFGDLYSSGRVEFEGDLVSFLEMVYTGLGSPDSVGWFRRLFVWLGHRRIANSLAKARDNIYHHYDICNDFYKLWLDTEAMQYTCAYFPDPTISLEQAQVAKLHHVCRKLQLKAGDTVVEAGCGWGGLARFMAKHYGVRVKAYNISHQQIIYAREQAEKQGLSDRVEYVEDDYRNIRGQFDVFVSVGMLEHVGKRDYRVLGDVVARSLKADGRGLIHSIGRIQPGPMNAWIERRIFPGSYTPSLREMMDIFEPNKFSVHDVENLRLHYAKTLEHWWQRFEKHSETIAGDLDEAFVRAWRLYLAGSIAAFTTGELQLFQVVFSRHNNNQLPWSRAHLYTYDDANLEEGIN